MIFSLLHQNTKKQLLDFQATFEQMFEKLLHFSQAVAQKLLQIIWSNF